MAANKTCYFTLTHQDAAKDSVRFGFSRRPDAQIEVSNESWKDIAARLRYEGFEFVELTPDSASGEASPPSQI